jgi:hypothetical protein
LFDPTIYDNIKVVLEGAVYDWDLAGRIAIIDRSDRVDLAVLARSYSVRFTERDRDGVVSAEMELHAGTADLASEIMEIETMKPGCNLTVRFFSRVKDEEACRAIRTILEELWGTEYRITQTLSYVYDEPSRDYRNETAIDFGRKFGEEVIEDIPRLIENIMQSLSQLNDLCGR